MTGKNVTDTRLARRRFLTLAGSVGLAGCSGLPFVGSEKQSVTLNGSAISKIGSESTISISEPLPVSIEQAYMDKQASHVRSLLNSMPNILGPEEIPNGAIRQQLTSRRTDAELSLQEATEGSPSLNGLAELRNACREAAYVAAAWKVINDDLTRAAITTQTKQVRNRLTTLRNRRQYVGNAPIRAVLAYGSVDELFGTAEAILKRRKELINSQLPAFVVGTLAAANEEARAAIDDGWYLYGRFTDSLSKQHPLRSIFKQTETAIKRRIHKQRQKLPEVDNPGALVDRDISDTSVAEALWRFYEEATEKLSELNTRSNGLAYRILTGQNQLATLIALETLQHRIEDGTTFTITSVSELRKLRSQAHSTIRSVRNAGQYPLLRQYLLTTATEMIESADEELQGLSRTVRVSSLEYQIGLYIRAAMFAEAVPEASQRVGDTLTN